MIPLNKVTVVVLSAFLASCASVSVTPRTSQVALPDAYVHGQATSTEAYDLAQWWQAWGDAELTRLVTQGLANNLDVAIAQTRIQEAQALSTMVSSKLMPTIGLEGGVQRQRTDLDQSPLRDTLLAPLMNESTRYDTHRSVGVSAIWEVDVFGGNRSDAAAAAEGVLGAEQQLYGTQMLVASGIAEHYLAARALAKRMRIVDDSILTLGQLLRYVEGRFNAGQVTRYEVTNVAASLRNLEAQRAPLQALHDRHVRQLAVLLGETPQGFTLGVSQQDVLAKVPAAPQGQAPNDVLTRRPDVQARAIAVRSQTARVASAKADLLPKFYINFLWQDGRIGLSDFNDAKGSVGLLGAGVHLPIFSAGRIRANIKASDARLDAAALAYDQTLLQALEEVDSAYQLRTGMDRQVAHQGQAYQAAAAKIGQADRLYRGGMKTLQDVLEARLQAQDFANALVNAQEQRALVSIQLYKALGGGWQADDQIAP